MTSPIDDYIESVKSSDALLSTDIVSGLVEQGAPISNDALNYVIKNNHEDLLRLFMRNGVVISTDTIDEIVWKGHVKMFSVMLEERENLPLSFDTVRLLSYYPEILEKAVVSVARGHPSRDVAQSYIEFLIQLPTLNAFSAFVKELNINVDDLLENAQETTPKLVSKKEYPRSKRGVTKMKRLLGSTPSKIHVDKSAWRLEHNDLCFCWDVPIGERTDLYVPVTRYGQSAGIGYYGREEYDDPSFTWYYVEPDSDFVLKSERAFVARNKIQAFLLFLEKAQTPVPTKQKGKPKQPKLSSRIKETKQLLEEHLPRVLSNQNIFHNYDTIRKYLLEETENHFGANEGITTFFRNWTNNHILFEGGKMDFLDESLSELMGLIGYEVLVLTHQPGNYGRLVSECLDVRKRSVSFSQIYEMV